MLKLRPRTANAADTSRIHVFGAALVAAALRVPYGARGLLAIVAWLGATAWYRPLTLPDEGRYVGVAWEMLRSGNWVVPTLNGMPFFHKPPLFYWITAVSMGVFGPNEAAARFASLLGATGAAWSVFLFVRRWVDERTGTMVLIVLLTTPLFFVGAQFANHDMLVAGCITVATLLAAHAVLSAESAGPHRWALAGSFSFAALGVLAKGLIGAALPALVLIAWILLTRRTRALVLLVWPPGLALFGLVASPWFILMQQRYGGFFDYFFVYQHFRRFTGTGFNNQQSWWFYLPILSLATLPWFVWIYRALRRDYFQPPERRDVRVLMWVWLVLVVLFFSLPQSKLVGYILPILPPLAFLLGDGMLSAFNDRSRLPGSAPLLIGGAAMVCLCTVVGVGLFGRVSSKPVAAALFPQMAPADQVLMLDGYVYDAPFYLRLTHPVLVADAWTDPDIARHDNWRKELHDAADFAPAAAKSALIENEQVAQVVCQPGTTWIFGSTSSAERFPWLSRGELSYVGPQIHIWRWTGSRREPGFRQACRGWLAAGQTQK